MAKKKPGAQKSAGGAAAAAVDDWGGTAKATKKKGGASPLMKYGGAAVATFAVLVMLSGGGGNPLVYLDAGDEAMLRKVFFSGETWAVACASPNDKTPLPDSVEAVAHRLGDEMKFGVVDCKAKMASGRTLTQRWKLKKQHDEDTVMFLSNGVSVTQIEASNFRSEYDLLRELRLLARRRPFMAKNTELLREKCWAKPRCLLVLQGGMLESPTEKALHALAGHHARGGPGRKGASAEDGSSVAFVAMDALEHKLPFEGYDLGDALKLRSFEAGAHRAVYFRNVSGAETLKALAHKGALTTEALGKFLGEVSLDSDEAPHPKLVDVKKGMDTLGIYRRLKKPKVKKTKITGGKDFSADAKKAEEAKKNKKPETAEELKAAFKEQQKREQEKRAKMDAESEDLFEAVDEEEEVEEEEEEEEEEMI